MKFYGSPKMEGFPLPGVLLKELVFELGLREGRVAVTLRREGTGTDLILGRRQENKVSEVGKCYLARAQGSLRSEWKIWLSWGGEGGC